MLAMEPTMTKDEGSNVFINKNDSDKYRNVSVGADGHALRKHSDDINAWEEGSRGSILAREEDDNVLMKPGRGGTWTEDQDDDVSTRDDDSSIFLTAEDGEGDSIPSKNDDNSISTENDGSSLETDKEDGDVLINEEEDLNVLNTDRKFNEDAIALTNHFTEAGLSDVGLSEMWSIITRYWSQEQRNHPSAREVAALFSRLPPLVQHNLSSGSRLFKAFFCHALSIEFSEVLDLTGHIDRHLLLASGRSSEVWDASWISFEKNRLISSPKTLPTVIVKSVRLPRLAEVSKDKRYRDMKREIEIWSKLDHPYILPFIGIAYIKSDTNLPALILPRMDCGNVMEFLKRNPSFPSFIFLKHIIKGLHYLHTLNPVIVHSNIKATNVLINHRKEACLSDVGLINFMVDRSFLHNTNDTPTWIAPELIKNDPITSTIASDMYAFGTVCYEIISGGTPFVSFGNDSITFSQMTDRQRLERIDSCHSNEIWSFITRCWVQEPEDRPSATKVLDTFSRLLSLALPLRALQQSLQSGPTLFKAYLCRIFSLQFTDVIDLTGHIDRDCFIASGGAGEVWEASWKGLDNNPFISTLEALPTVVVKLVKVTPLRDKVTKAERYKKMKRELLVWSKLNHPNVLPLIGIACIEGDPNLPALISPRMDNGNVMKFLKQNPSFPASRFLTDIIKGLNYLHTFDPVTVHGDIKGANVLINHRKQACLSDFGLSRFIADNSIWRTAANHAGGTLHWMAPELIIGDTVTPTTATDIYAFGMTCYEILSRGPPFASAKEITVIRKVTTGKRPERIESCHSDQIWSIITRCWEHKPEDRPSSEEVLDLILASQYDPPSDLCIQLPAQDYGYPTSISSTRFYSAADHF